MLAIKVKDVFWPEHLRDQNKEISMSDGIFLGGGGTGYADAQQLLLEYANRHGLIVGATGTGKTVTLQILAEGFSSIGVPVFCPM